jgi:hypothetical protein
MSNYIIVLSEGLYKIYRQMSDNQITYQYCGATFVMYKDAEDFINMRNSDTDAS